MRTQLREMVEYSAASIHNFFVGFLSSDQLRAEVKPLRRARPAKTLYALNEADVPERSRSERLIQDSRLQDPKLA